ncbi:recombinase family protein [Microbacterium maritypicum]
MGAVIYGRISDDPTGKAAGVDRQLDECRRLATTAGVEVIAELLDNDLSATTGKRRPGFERVLELIRGGDVDTVIIWHTDRLYRLPRDLEPIIDLAEGRRLRFLTVTSSEIDLNTASGRMVARILAAASAQEVEHKAERQKSASDQRAARGLPTARPGYGYQRADGRDLIVEPEAAVIRDAARRVLASESLRAIAADLNARAVPSPGGAPWQGITLRQMLRRPSLAGLRTHRGAVVGKFDAELHPPILDADTHERLVAVFDDPARRRPSGGRTPRHLLSGLAECGLCENTLGGRMHRLPPWQPKTGSKSKPVKAAYACNRCHKVRRLQEPVDDLVDRIIVGRLERPDAAELFTTGDPAAARELREAIDAADARLALAADQFADGALTGDQLRRITEKLRNKRTELERQLADALPPQMPQNLVGPRARSVWDGLHIDAKRSVIRALARIIIMPTGTGRSFNPDDVRILWHASM